MNLNHTIVLLLAIVGPVALIVGMDLLSRLSGDRDTLPGQAQPDEQD